MSKSVQSSRHQSRQEKKRREQLRSIGIMIVGVIIVLGAVVGLNYAGNQAVVVSEPPQRIHPQADNNALGDPNAPVVVEVYSSFSCGHCLNYFNDVEEQFINDFVSVGVVYYVYKPYHDSRNAMPNLAYNAALCAGEQDAFWPMHDWLFANFDSYTTIVLNKIAENIGLDMNAYKSCMNDNKYYDQVIAETEDVFNNLGVTGTPTFVVNGVVAVVGNAGYEAMSQAVMEAYEAAKGE